MIDVSELHLTPIKENEFKKAWLSSGQDTSYLDFAEDDGTMVVIFTRAGERYLGHVTSCFKIKE